MNIFTLDISNGLRDHEVGAGEYLLLIDAPPLANVTVKPNSQFGATGIPLKSGHDVRSRKEVNKWFISADAVAGGTIKILMSDSDEPLTINTVPSDVNVSEIGSLAAFGAAALAQLDKAINPYELGVLSGGTTSFVGTTTLLNKTLTCDSFDLFLSLRNTGHIVAHGVIVATLDGITVSIAGAYNDTYGNGVVIIDRATIHNCKGKTLSIVSTIGATQNISNYSLVEKTLKA